MISTDGHRPVTHPLLRILAERLDCFGITTASRVGVGFSGGRDSVALLALLYALPIEQRPRLLLLHFDHGIRPMEETSADVALARQYGESMALECVVGHIPHGQLQGQATTKHDRRMPIGGLEALAREARYTFYSSMARKHRLDFVLLAHHLDDHCETVLMRLLQGSGLAGLGGIPERRSVEKNGYAYQIGRPLLHIAADMLHRYVSKQGLPYHEDITNHSAIYLRNRVRTELMPAIARCFGSYRGAIARVAQMARDSYEALRQESAQQLVWRPSGAGFEIERQRFFEAPGTLRLHSLYALAERNRPPVPRLPYRFLYPATQQDRPQASYRLLRGHGIELVVSDERIIWKHAIVAAPKNRYYCIVVDIGMPKKMGAASSAPNGVPNELAVGVKGGAHFMLRDHNHQPPVVFRSAHIDDMIDGVGGLELVRGRIGAAEAFVIEDRRGIVCAFDNGAHAGELSVVCRNSCRIAPLGSDGTARINIELDSLVER